MVTITAHDAQHLQRASDFSHCASGALRNASLRANAREGVEKEGDEREGCRAKIRISEETVKENDRQISFNYKQDGGGRAMKSRLTPTKATILPFISPRHPSGERFSWNQCARVGLYVFYSKPVG